MNEFELIGRITNRAPRSTRDLACGVGDDCAIIEDGARDLLITTDALVENVHFDLRYTDAQSLGGRMVDVNISDIAAMGGTPRFFLVALVMPPHVDHEQCALLYEGMYEHAGAHDVALIGGDTTAGAQLAVAITLIGETRHGTAIRRAGARSGDAIYVTGQLGGGALGLACLKAGCDAAAAAPFIRRYRHPEPRVAAGRWLADTGMVTSMIDISDGLLADAGHLASASETGYEIMVDDVPHHPDLGEVAKIAGVDPMDILLGGGDDYELAFTVDGSRTNEFAALLNGGSLPFEHAITRVGTVVGDAARQAVIAADGSLVEIKARGYDHFGGGSTAP